jgi:Mn2+/Fe2+ NRAMP family transporter
MATAAIGGSHLVASTQAGALFGWQLIWLILLVNILKYPFFRFGVEYTLANNESLLSGYARRGKVYLYSFMLLNIVSAVVNTAGVLLLTASLLQYALPFSVSVTLLCWIVLALCLVILLLGHYRALDTVAKIIMVILTLTTITAAGLAWQHGSNAPIGYVVPSPWQLSSLGFLVALIGWMPAPIEFSAITSQWLLAKQQQRSITRGQGLFDFNLGFWTAATLALVFVSLGALVQYGTDQPITMASAAFAQQLVDMYAQTIGNWARPLVATIAFLCMFGTTITVLDGYARTLDEASGLLGWQAGSRQSYWLIVQSCVGMGVILFFKSALGPMVTFAMTLAFLTTPVFAWLNYRVMPRGLAMSLPLRLLSWVGLAYLTGFTLFFLLSKTTMAP